MGSILNCEWATSLDPGPSFRSQTGSMGLNKEQTMRFESAGATAERDSVNAGVRRVSGVLCSALHNFVFEHSLLPFSGS